MTSPLFHTRRHSLTISNTINEKGSPIKNRICAQYLPKYHHKLKLSNNKILSPSEDRLSELTTKQIDRLIEMQKIKNLLNENKKGIKPTHINYVGCEPNKHPNVYQPNFMAKINKIALDRNIRHLRSEEFDKATLSPQQLRKKGLDLQKKNLRFVKDYKIDKQKKTVVSYEDEQQKSIDSIQNQQALQQFQADLEYKKFAKLDQRDSKLQKYKHKKTNILSMTRWFNGMSTHYINLDKNNQVGGDPIPKPGFDQNFDMEYTKSHIVRENRWKSVKFGNSRISTVG